MSTTPAPTPASPAATAPDATPATPSEAAERAAARGRAMSEALASAIGKTPHQLAEEAIQRNMKAAGHLRKLQTDTGHAVVATVRPGFETAAWSFDGSRHQIDLGDRFMEAIQQAPLGGRSHAQHVRDFADQLLRHEAWHGRLTQRDLVRVAALCRSRRVPFILFNVFEDARIEAAARLASGDKFNWRRWMRTTITCDEPLEAFCQSIIHEEPKAALNTITSGPDGKRRFTSKQDADVANFYKRACAAPSSLALVDLCVEWLEYWRSDKGNKRADGGTIVRPGTIPGLHDEIGEESDGSATEARTTGAERADAEEKAVGSAVGHRIVRDSGSLLSTTSERQQLGYYADGERSPIDWQAVTRLAQRLSQVVVAAASNSTARLASSGSRLHIPALASQSDSAFRAPGKRGGTPTCVVVVDMSGSMAAEWAAHGRIFTAAILRLMREGKLRGHIVLTGGTAHYVLPADITDAQFATINPNHRNEAIALTLEAVRDLVTQAHFTVVYTDGQITDGSVDAKRWRMRGVELTGACVIPDGKSYSASHIREAMIKHFGNAVIAPTGEALALALVARIGNAAAGR